MAAVAAKRKSRALLLYCSHTRKRNSVTDAQSDLRRKVFLARVASPSSGSPRSKSTKDMGIRKTWSACVSHWSNSLRSKVLLLTTLPKLKLRPETHFSRWRWRMAQMAKRMKTSSEDTLLMKKSTQEYARLLSWLIRSRTPKMYG